MPAGAPTHRFVPMASISSIKTMEGAFSSATRKSSRTSLGPSPLYFWMSSEPTTRRKVAEVWLATALASSVLPVRGKGERERGEKMQRRSVSATAKTMGASVALPRKVRTGAGRAVQDDALGRLDAHLLVVLGMRQGELHRFLRRSARRREQGRLAVRHGQPQLPFRLSLPPSPP